MTDPVPDSRPPTRWLWVVLIVLLAVALVIVFLNPTGDAEEDAAADVAAENGDGSRLIATEPNPDAVPVDLPDTPVEETSPETGPETGAETGAPPPADY